MKLLLFHPIEVDICKEPLKFTCGTALTRTFMERRVRVFRNATWRPSSMYGYIIFDYDGSILKYCRACSICGLKEAVILH